MLWLPGPSLRGVALAVGGLACSPIAAAGPECASAAEPIALPGELRESSGVAFSRRDPQVLWTHNDDGSVLFAVTRAGRVRARFPVRPRLRDWEDLAVAACAQGTCLYLADTGDNTEGRAPGDARILRVPEPDPSAPGRLERLDAFPIRLPNGPRDVEALFVLPGERLYLVTKGRRHDVSLYRYPAPLRPEVVTLEEVQTLAEGPQFLLDQVTGAGASPSGAVVALRSYQSLRFFGFEGDTLAPIPNGLVDLRGLQEAQGEAVAIGADGQVALTSEGGPFGRAPSLNLLRCTLPD